MMSKMLDPFEELANAIVLQAVKDYREANSKLARGRRNLEAEEIKEECLRFFRSGLFPLMTSVEPELLIKKLDAEVMR